MAGEPNAYSDADLDEILASKDARIAELEAACEAALRALVGNEPPASQVVQQLRKALKQ